VFKSENFLTIGYIVGDIKLRGLFKKELIIQELSLGVEELEVVTSAGGNKNYSLFFDNLKAVADAARDATDKIGVIAKRKREKPEQSKVKVGIEAQKFPLIEKLGISIGKVCIGDESTGQKRDYPINYSRVFTDVHDSKKVWRDLVADLLKFWLPFLANSLISSVITLPETAIDGAIKVKDVSSSIVDKTTDAVGKITETIGSSLKKILPGNN
jgi:hypothetical protein